MRKLISILVAAAFAAVTFSAYAADPAPAGDAPKATKPAKKKKKAPSSSSSSSSNVQQGAAPSSGRGDPSGAASGGAVQVAPATGAGRSDNK